MPASYSYTTLKAAIQDYAADTGAKLAAAIDSTIIPNAESRTLRDLDLEIFDVTANITFATGNPSVSKPGGWLATRTVSWINGSSLVPLLLRSYEYITDYNPNPTTTGSVIYYSELNDASWQVAPAPPGNVTGTARYMKRPAGLSGSNATTWLGTNVGDLLLKSSMIEFLLWSKNTSTAGYGKSNLEAWEGEYALVLATSRKEFAHLIRSESQQGAK